MTIGLLEMRRRKLQFVLIALVVTLISYLVLMINGLGVGLNDRRAAPFAGSMRTLSPTQTAPG